MWMAGRSWSYDVLSALEALCINVKMDPAVIGSGSLVLANLGGYKGNEDKSFRCFFQEGMPDRLNTFKRDRSLS